MKLFELRTYNARESSLRQSFETTLLGVLIAESEEEAVTKAKAAGITLVVPGSLKGVMLVEKPHLTVII